MTAPWRAWLLAFSLGLNAVLAGAYVYGQIADRHSHAKDTDEDLIAALQLSDQQRQAWDTIMRDQDREMLRMKAASLQRVDRLESLMTREDVSPGDLQGFLETMKQSAGDYTATVLESFLNQREILDPAQEQQLKATFKLRLARMREWNSRRFLEFRQNVIARYGESFVQDALADLPAIPPVDGGQP
jgi:hypothetical protein